jgi:hypothetical protein
VERERGKEREKTHSPLHPCMRAPEWNYLCWLVESKREEKERGKVALLEREKWNFLPFESLNTGPLDLFLSDISGACEWQSTLPFESSILVRACLFLPSQHMSCLDGMLILHVDPTIKISELLCIGQKD